MKVEGVGQSVPVEPVKLDPGNQARGASREPNRAVKEEISKKAEESDPRTIKKAVDLLNKTMESYNTELRFTFHEKSGEYMVKIVDTRDNTVIREIPPKKVLDMVAYFKEMIGLVVDKFI